METSGSVEMEGAAGRNVRDMHQVRTILHQYYILLYNRSILIRSGYLTDSPQIACISLVDGGNSGVLGRISSTNELC